MIMVKIELWPNGDRTRRRQIAAIAVANVSELADVSDYVAVRWTDAGAMEAVSVRAHRRSAGIWPLLARAASPRASRRIARSHQATVEAIVNRVVLPGNDDGVTRGYAPYTR